MFHPGEQLRRRSLSVLRENGFQRAARQRSNDRLLVVRRPAPPGDLDHQRRHALPCRLEERGTGPLAYEQRFQLRQPPRIAQRRAGHQPRLSDAAFRIEMTHGAHRKPGDVERVAPPHLDEHAAARRRRKAEPRDDLAGLQRVPPRPRDQRLDSRLADAFRAGDLGAGFQRDEHGQAIGGERGIGDIPADGAHVAQLHRARFRRHLRQNRRVRVNQWMRQQRAEAHARANEQLAMLQRNPPQRRDPRDVNHPVASDLAAPQLDHKIRAARQQPRANARLVVQGQCLFQGLCLPIFHCHLQGYKTALIPSIILNFEGDTSRC